MKTENGCKERNYHRKQVSLGWVNSGLTHTYLAKRKVEQLDCITKTRNRTNAQQRLLAMPWFRDNVNVFGNDGNVRICQTDYGICQTDYGVAER